MLCVQPAVFHQRARTGQLCVQCFGQLPCQLQISLRPDTTPHRDNRIRIRNIHLLREPLHLVHPNAIGLFGLRQRHGLHRAPRPFHRLWVGKNFIPHGAKLGTVVRGNNARHNVSAKSGTYLYKIGILLHLQHGAICGKAVPKRAAPRGARLRPRLVAPTKIEEGFTFSIKSAKASAYGSMVNSASAG